MQSKHNQTKLSTNNKELDVEKEMKDFLKEEIKKQN